MPSTRSDRENKAVLLTVSPDRNDPCTLESILDDWTVKSVPTCSEALALLRRGDCALVLAEKELPDGRWHDLLTAMRSLDHTPPLIVMSKLADESLWAEVLREGGFDVLAKPLEKSEVRRICPGAVRSRAGSKTFAQAS